MAKTINSITLDELNSHLIERLDTLVREVDDPEGMLAITNAVSKLNVSFRNNDQFARPETAEEALERQQREAFGDALQEADIAE